MDRTVVRPCFLTLKEGEHAETQYHVNYRWCSHCLHRCCRSRGARSSSIKLIETAVFVQRWDDVQVDVDDDG